MGNLRSFATPMALAFAAAGLSSITARGDFLYTGYRNNEITRVDERTGQVIQEFGTYADGFESFRGMTLGPDGLLYVSALRKHASDVFGSWGVYRFDPQTGKFLGIFMGWDPIDWIEFGPDGDFYGVYAWTNELVRYDGVTGARRRVVLSVEPSYWGVGSFAFSPDGQLFAVTDSSKLAKYDPDTGERTGPITDLAELGLVGFGFDRLAFGPSGELFAAYNYRFRDTVLDGGIMRFDPETGALIDTIIDDVPAFGAASGGTLGVAFGPDGNLYVGSQHAKAVLRYDPRSGAKIDEISLVGFVQSATFIQFLPIPEPTTACLLLLAVVSVTLYLRSR